VSNAKCLLKLDIVTPIDKLPLGCKSEVITQIDDWYTVQPK